MLWQASVSRRFAAAVSFLYIRRQILVRPRGHLLARRSAEQPALEDDLSMTFLGQILGFRDGGIKVDYFSAEFGDYFVGIHVFLFDSLKEIHD
jgi:hypothetical protein